jgi:hypothetical protein
MALASHTEQGHVLAAVVSESEAVFDMPLKVAVTVAVCMVLTVAAVAEKIAWDVDANTVTDAGTVSMVLLSESATARLAGAAELSVMVQVPLAPAGKVAGAHTSDVSVTEGVRLIEAVFALPLSAAVTIAVCAPAIVPAVALNVPLVAPAAMVME